MKYETIKDILQKYEEFRYYLEKAKEIYRYFERYNDNKIESVCETAVYAYKRNSWFLDPTWYSDQIDKEIISKPIFLLGTESSGLTFTSRIIRRNTSIFSVSGGHNFWCGPDEMALVMEPMLPKSLQGININRHSELYKHNLTGNWIYACDNLYEYYKKDKSDIDQKSKERFTRLIKWRKSKYGNSEGDRFIDKSQLFSVKIGLLDHFLTETKPYFVLVVRNPFAVVKRASEKNPLKYAKSLGKGREAAIKIAAQHWYNTTKHVIEYALKAENVFLLRFEELLKSPTKTAKKMCKVLDIDFNNDMLPKKHHSIPFGAKGKRKWFPIRHNVNEKHINRLDKKEKSIIKQECSGIWKKLGYKPKTGDLDRLKPRYLPKKINIIG